MYRDSEVYCKRCNKCFTRKLALKVHQKNACADAGMIVVTKYICKLCSEVCIFVSLFNKKNNKKQTNKKKTKRDKMDMISVSLPIHYFCKLYFISGIYEFTYNVK